MFKCIEYSSLFQKENVLYLLTDIFIL